MIRSCKHMGHSNLPQAHHSGSLWPETGEGSRLTVLILEVDEVPSDPASRLIQIRPSLRLVERPACVAVARFAVWARESLVEHSHGPDEVTAMFAVGRLHAAGEVKAKSTSGLHLSSAHLQPSAQRLPSTP